MEWNSNKPFKSSLKGKIQGSVEREVTKNISGSPVRIISEYDFYTCVLNN